jgi:signal transduction histidine kinase
VRGTLPFGFIMRDSPDLIMDSIDGAARVTGIVQNLKEFSHVDQGQKKWVNLHAGIESTLKLIWNELKYKTEIVKEFGEICEIECYPQQINQIFLNLLANAGQAIQKEGTITIRTYSEDQGVVVEIGDTGAGIATEHLPRIFEPFFTTKPIGKGTGLGLSIVYSIVRQHQGRIEVKSEIGQGTVFTLHLPIRFSEELKAGALP